MNRRVLVVDNHDSFVHTLCGYLTELGAEVTLVESDEINAAIVPTMLSGFAGVMISPGPGHPDASQGSRDAVHYAATHRVPVLGVCLGHQVIAEYFGARVGFARELMHGMTSSIQHDGTELFAGLPSPFEATRYHSLAVQDEATWGADVVVTARTETGTIMALAHRTLPIYGVQFHPESVLTMGGHRLLGNWLERVGIDGAAARGAQLHP